MTQSAPAVAIDAVLTEHADLERQLTDPDLHSDAGNARRVGRRFAQLAPIVTTYRKLEAVRGDLEAARELAADDASFADEVTELEARAAELDDQLTDMLAPRDPHDADDIVLEVKSGEGGEESALFAADLVRMYSHYADGRGAVGVIASVTDAFCDRCDRIRLTAEGRLRSCLFALDEVDLRRVVRDDAADAASTDAAIAAAIRGAVADKWAGHHIAQPVFVRPSRSMSQIGG